MNTPPPADDQSPELAGYAPQVAGYTVERRLDVATPRPVWVARNPDRRRVLLMQVSDDLDLTARQRLRHPHLINCLDDTRSAAGDRVLALDFLAGGSLAQLLTSRGELSPGEVVTVLTPLAEAVQCLHENGLTAGAIGPADVLFGEDGRPVLCDLAVPAPAGHDPAADVTAIGAIGWFTLTGHLPQRPATRAPLTVLSPQTPVELTSLIERCVAEDPGHRPASSDLALHVFDACPAAPVELLPPPDGDPDTNLTQRLRRRSDEVAPADALEALLGGAPVLAQRCPDTAEDFSTRIDLPTAGVALSPTPSLRRDGTAGAGAPRPGAGRGSARLPVDRASLRRPPAEPVRRRPGRAVLIGAALALTVLGGAAAAAFVFRSHATTSPAAATGSPTSKPGTQATSSASTAPSGTGSPASTPGTAASDGSPGTAGTTGSDDSDGSTSAGTPAEPEDSPATVLAALQQLSTLRAGAYQAGDASKLTDVNAPGSPAQAQDLDGLTGLTEKGQSMRGIQFRLSDLTVQSSDATTATVALTTTTGAYDVVQGGAVISHVEARAPRRVTVTMVKTAQGWRIQDVA